MDSITFDERSVRARDLARQRERCRLVRVSPGRRDLV
jgi:hypothetical protein